VTKKRVPREKVNEQQKRKKKKAATREKKKTDPRKRPVKGKRIQSQDRIS
jgi:hypothetical protein